MQSQRFPKSRRLFLCRSVSFAERCVTVAIAGRRTLPVAVVADLNADVVVVFAVRDSVSIVIVIPIAVVSVVVASAQRDQHRQCHRG